MKIKITKIICLLLVLSMLFTITSFGAYTTDMTSEVYTFEYEDRTIEIDAEGLTYEQAQIIADKMIYGEDGASTYGILCIFGHKLDMTVAAETTHKYYSDNAFHLTILMAYMIS